MKRTSLRAKMVIGIIPVVIIAMLVVTIVSTTRSSSAIEKITQEKASEVLGTNITSIEGTLTELKATAVTASRTVGGTYKSAKLSTYDSLFKQIVGDHDIVYGAGIWFEEGVYNGKKYAGPYWAKDDSGKVNYTDEYSDESYNYFEQEYYKLAKAVTTMEAHVTDPYYDESSGKMLTTTYAPIFNDNDQFIGCVTVTVCLDSIQEKVSKMTVGKKSEPMFFDSKGAYLYSKDAKKVTEGITLDKDSNASLAALSSKVMGNEYGVEQCKMDGNDTMVFYDTVDSTGWKLLVTLDKDEMNATATSIRNLLIIILIVAVIVTALMVIILVNSIVKSVKMVQSFAGELAKGDFTVAKINARSRDELGQMSSSLNDMYESNRSVIGQVSDESVKISDSSEELTGMADTLATNFDGIRGNMRAVNDAMMSASAATEEVNASVEEVDASVQMLSGEANRNKDNADEIQRRALSIEAESQQAYNNAIKISEDRQKEIEKANEQAGIVREIGSLADSIAEIADQINLLSLNASIEAARAGEHGKGFAVVATEINNLANETAEAVGRIQQTVEGVQGSFDELLNASNGLMEFIKDTVAPDYEHFVGVAKQYGSDAQEFGEQSEQINEMVENIRSAMREVSSAIQAIAESTQETADRSSQVNDTVSDVSDVVDNVSNMAGAQNTIAKSLSDVVGQFKL